MLVELLLAIGLSAIIFPALLTGFIASREAKPQQKQRMLATTLIKETEQAAISVRDVDWTLFATFSATPLHPVISGGRWALVPGAETINGLTRQIVISDVYRDANGAITTSGGNLDPSTKKITSTVSWALPFWSNISSVMFLTRTDNAIQTQTTQADFNAGTKNSVTVKATTPSSIIDDGQIEISGGGHGDWCTPSAYITNKLTLPRPGNAIVSFPGSAIGSPDSVYVGTGNGSLGESFVHLSVSDPQPPDLASPAATIIGTYSSSDKTNAIYVNNGYAFLATNATSNQIKVIRLSDNSLFKTIDIESDSPAKGIYIAYNVLYVTSDTHIYLYDVSNLNNIVPLPSQPLQNVHADGYGEQLAVVGTKLYVSVSDSNLGLQVFTINIGGTLTYWGSAKIGWNTTAKGLAVSSTGDRAYVAFVSTDTPNGFYIADTAHKGNNPYVGTVYNSSGMVPNGIALATSDIAILVGSGSAEQYQVVNGLSTDNPVHCGGMPVQDGADGVSTIIEQDSDVYSYLISGSTHDQFMIIEGGAGGGGSGTAGDFESSTIDASYSAAFNRFTANVSQPVNTSIQMQVAVAQSPPPYTSCDGAIFTFLGPDGTSGTYFTPIGATISGQIPFGTFAPSYQNPARCFRYRANFSTTNINSAPHLYDFTVNYSQ